MEQNGDWLEIVQKLLLLGIFIFMILAVLAVTVLRHISDAWPNIVRHKEEKGFLDPVTGQTEPFPRIEDEPTIDLSVIVPAYNEELRLPAMLDEALEYLENRTRKTECFKYEVIIVSDGSKDRTVEVGHDYSKKFGTQKVRVLKLIENRGKGGAVRLGMQSGRGKNLLFADADGATRFCDFEKLEDSLNQLVPDWRNEAIVVGSRAHLEQEAIASRSFFRTILMYGFHFLVWLFTVRGVKDTQCGFKLLTRSAAASVFRIMHVERWAFDVELLFIAQSHGMPINEVAVKWTEIDGSKVTPVWSWLQMGCDLLLIWLKYTTGAWKVDLPKSED